MSLFRSLFLLVAAHATKPSVSPNLSDDSNDQRLKSSKLDPQRLGLPGAPETPFEDAGPALPVVDFMDDTDIGNTIGDASLGSTFSFDHRKVLAASSETRLLLFYKGEVCFPMVSMREQI